MYSCGSLHMAEQRQDDQLKPTYSSSVPIQDVALKTCREQWTIGRGDGRGLRISVLMARHSDDVIFECPFMSQKAVKMLQSFATTYSCKTTFSALAKMMTKYRSRWVQNELHVSNQKLTICAIPLTKCHYSV